MTALLSLFTGSLTVPFAGSIIAAIVLAGGGFYAYERTETAAEVSGLNSKIDALNCKIDGPTSKACPGDGYIVQIGRANAATAQVRANLGTCQATVTDSNAKLDALSAQGAARTAAAAKAQADLAASQRAAQQAVAQIASFKPTADACVDAGTILRSIGR